MKEIKFYYCEKCDKEFNNEFQCLEHEKQCGVKNKFICYKCDKRIEYTTNNEYDDNFDFNYNECWILSPNHYRAGYGSKLDGCEFKLNLCDDCLIDFIKTFTYEGQEKVFNTGSNCELDTDTWIRMHNGTMLDEEYEKLGYYNP